MDDSFNLARHIARFVVLLMKQPDAVDQQKLELRALVLLTKEGTVRLSTREGELVANKLLVPSILAGVRELSDQMIAHQVDAIEIGQNIAPGEMLALGRALATPAAEDVRTIRTRFAVLEGKTISVTLRPETEDSGGTEAEESAEPEPPQGSPERIPYVLGRANRGGAGKPLAALFEEVVFSVEQATRTGDTLSAITVFSQLIAFEALADDPEVRRHYVLAARRLTKPPILHPIARVMVDDPELGGTAQSIISRCGMDGADAVIDQLVRAASSDERARYTSALARTPAANEALVGMLADSRPHMVRAACELLGSRQPADADRALADRLQHEDGRVRRAVVRALGLFDTAFSLAAAARALDDLVAEVRLEAVAAVARRPEPRMSEVLLRALAGEEHPDVQVAILRALGKVGTTDAVSFLIKTAEGSGGKFGGRKDPAMRVVAVRALASAHSGAARQALVTLSSDREREVREVAARAAAR
ncbi:MAG: hypothetical protein FJ202_00350 [Gemmatimonadetes bacterium]|nr:hypothetical protein [Gemmatimonadota bacterium]